MVSAKECDKSYILHGINWLLQKVYAGFLRITHFITSLQRKEKNF
jgi:hypothetical protein